jgi:uncharacterized protein
MRKSYTAFVLVAAAFTAGVFFSGPEETTIPEENSASSNIVAAAQNSNTGAIGKVTVEAVPGDGDVLVETDPFIQADTQVSAQKAKEVAEQYTGKNLEDYNLIYRTEMDSQVVGGPSAGAAMTLATIAAATDREVREDAAITGTITESGRIGRVGEIPVKAYAAGEAGLNRFYVPKGQTTKVNYKPVVKQERRGFLVYQDVEYRRQEFNISSYTQENFQMRTSEVENIYKAPDRMLK